MVYIGSIHLSKYFSQLRLTADLHLSAGKTTIDVSGCNSSKALSSSLERLSLECLEFEI